MSERDERRAGAPPGGPGEHLPEGEEAPPQGVRTMALVRWSLVALMALAAVAAWVHHADLGPRLGRAAATLYRCPMHPAVMQDRPGSCPVCGMDLVPAQGGAPPSMQAGSGTPAGAAQPGGATPAAAAGKYWCPMHPEVASDDPDATCAKCGGMKLVPRPGAPVGPGGPVPGLVPVEISAERTQLMGMQTARVLRQPLARRLRTVGYVAANERAVAVVTARPGGWVGEVKVAQAGERIRKGDVLLTLNSTELLSAQQAYLDALRWKKTLAERTPGELAPAAQAVDRDSLRRLRLYGVAREDIEALEKRGQAAEVMPVRAPVTGYLVRNTVLPGQWVAPGTELAQIADLSTVWVVAEVYEQDMGRVAVGQKATLMLPAWPGERFAGRVQFIYPALSRETRTLQARMEFQNRDLKLRPGMYGDVVIELAAPDALTVPAEAVVDTGEVQYVFVAGPGGRFEPRVVRAGGSAEGRTELLGGVAEGESVVTTANFLLDSESRLRAAVEAHAASPAGQAAR